jgi:hypothetical protein
MTGTCAPALTRPLQTRPRSVMAAARLLRIELRHNAMLWLLPVVIALFWITTYRKIMAMPPLWYLRATSMQSGALVDFACPVVGAAAWVGSREARRRTTDLAAITARPFWVRMVIAWAATTCWALAGFLGCLAVVDVRTAQQASFGGPLWWPAVVVAAGLVALSAAGTGAHLAGGVLDVAWNTAGLAGLGLLSAGLLGGGLAWVGPTGYLAVGVYGLYTQWHGPALTTPWIWPARSPHDLVRRSALGLCSSAG